jgi:hypothetical protein
MVYSLHLGEVAPAVLIAVHLVDNLCRMYVTTVQRSRDGPHRP